MRKKSTRQKRIFKNESEMLSDQGQPLETSKPDDPYERDWIPVPEYSYLIKYIFSDAKYHILVSNLTSVFEEEITDTDVEARFLKLNPHVKMKPQVMLENIKKSLKQGLSGESLLHLKLEDNKMTITLDFLACYAVCKYDIEMTLMPTEKVMQYIIVPTILGSLLSRKKILELQKNLENKAKPPFSSKTYSSTEAIDPEWLKGKNVPFQFVCDSFLSIQSHFKELFSENNAAYISCKRVIEDDETKAHSVIHHKRVKLTKYTKEGSSLNFEEEGSDTIEAKREKTQNKEPSCVILIRNVSSDAKETDIKSLASGFGHVTNVILFKEKNEALLEMEDEASAITMVNFYVNYGNPLVRDRIVDVQFSNRKELKAENVHAIGGEGYKSEVLSESSNITSKKKEKKILKI